MTNSLCYVPHNLTLLCVHCCAVIYFLYYISTFCSFVLFRVKFFESMYFCVLCFLYLFALYVTELLVIRVNPFFVIVVIFGFTSNVLGSVFFEFNLLSAVKDPWFCCQCINTFFFPHARLCLMKMFSTQLNSL